MALIDNFNVTLDTWIIQLRTYDLPKLLAKPGEESWSMGQLYVHLLEETNWFMGQLKGCIGSSKNADKHMTAEAVPMFENNKFPDKVIKGDPVISEKVPQPLSAARLLDEMYDLKFRMRDLSEKITGDKNRGKTAHPGLGYFNAGEWLQYSEMHLRHHFSQKTRIDEFLKLM